MKYRTILLSLITFTILIYSCKKDNDETPAPPIITSYPDYSTLKTGNYWVYEQFSIDTSGNAISNNVFDSCYVDMDTIINSHTYFKVVRPNQYNPNDNYSFIRDSLHYIVNSNGRILFSSEDYQTVFNSFYLIVGAQDTIYHSSLKMDDINATTLTPAGVFTTINAKETYFIYPNYASYTDNKYKNVRYAKNIGIVTETLPIFIATTTNIERRLVRYHLN